LYIVVNKLIVIKEPHRYILQKSCPSSKVKVTRDKKRKTAESSPLTMHSKACTIGGTSMQQQMIPLHATRGWWTMPVVKSVHAVYTVSMKNAPLSMFKNLTPW